MNGKTPVTAVLWISAGALTAQAMQAAAAVPAGESVTFISQADRLGLAGALIVAVGVLWRALAKKDDQLVDMTKAVTAAMTMAADSNKELRAVIAESIAAKEKLAGSVDTLTRELSLRPCLVTKHRA